MKIAIIGTRGIPNNYGGFEQLAEYLSLGLKEKGHDVYVYNSDKHAYKHYLWNGINIIHCFDPEKTIGTAGQFIYDFNCIVNSRKHNFDVILNLGYTSSSIWMRLFSKRARVITNMDGMEWKRSKYSKKVQRFLMYAEKLAVKHSQLLVADSLAIKKYLDDKYRVNSHFIAYGAPVFTDANAAVLEKYKVTPYTYNLLIARMEPENNIEMILDGVHGTKNSATILVIGNHTNAFGTYLFQKYQSDERIVFTGPLYDVPVINNLRYYSNLYFHGHSVGGTNPSLLEAMGCHCHIAAHNNEFNKSVLQNNALYFSSASEVSHLIENENRSTPGGKINPDNNQTKIKTDYTWANIVNAYEKIMI
ncbi:MAG: DUF1972 domain-containing protein [Bacteroidia bacterium]|nr:DUF1972 domain-containing protein [Bacteroidia bacterium]